MIEIEKALDEVCQHRPHVDKNWPRAFRRLQKRKQQQTQSKSSFLIWHRPIGVPALPPSIIPFNWAEKRSNP
jgi:hypothetical protein